MAPTLLTVSVLVLGLSLCQTSASPFRGSDFLKLTGQFDSWAAQHKKVYESEETYLQRLTNFAHNIREIRNINDANLSYKAGLNEFSDMTWEEFKDAFLLKEPQDCSATSTQRLEAAEDPLPEHVDWRTKHVITPVKNQGHCGSCWTFSTTGCLEAHHAMATGHLVSLSEQQLVDCAQAFNNHGCDGGLPSQAFEYVRYNHGLESEADYPYFAKDGTCKFSAAKVAATVTGVFNITQDDEDELTQAVAFKGPVSIAYEVTAGFQHYKSGVYSNILCHKDPQHVNHAVLAVGYGVVAESGEKYWIVKNSWGTTFGLKGYFWIRRGTNECGLATCASYPIV